MLSTSHLAYLHNASRMEFIEDESVDLVVTSPPYPMIEMWDASFAAQDRRITQALAGGDGQGAFELMHSILDEVWGECLRVLKTGGFACINIGDATRSVGQHFSLYPNHARIISAMGGLGLESLPAILWRKQTNGPNKFMGSGMLPAGAYVTLEHEYILVFRKGGKRVFSEQEKVRRRRSAYFWEERNSWFSDIWDLKGVRQRLASGSGSSGAVYSGRAGEVGSGGTGEAASSGAAGSDKKRSRERSGAYPFELAYRLVNMYSIIGDTVLDPFLGTGTSVAAALAAARSSIGFEIEPRFIDELPSLLRRSLPEMNERIRTRFEKHLAFIEEREIRGKKKLRHYHEYYGFPVMTAQERELRIPYVDSIESGPQRLITASYREVSDPFTEYPLQITP